MGDPVQDDIETMIADKIANLEHAQREIESQLNPLRVAANALRGARGTGVEPVLPPSVERRATPRQYVVMQSDVEPSRVAERAPEVVEEATTQRTDEVVTRIRAILEHQTLPIAKLSKQLGMTTTVLVPILNELIRTRQAYQFHDSSYTWCIGDAGSKAIQAYLKRLLQERWMSRREIGDAVGVNPITDPKLAKRVKENYVDELRSHEPVWMTRNERGLETFKLVAGKNPPPEMDGRIVRDRSAKKNNAKRRGRRA